MSYNDFRELNRNQRNGRFLGFRVLGYRKRGKGEVTLRGASTLEPAQVGRDHQGGSCWLLVLVSRHRKAQAAIISNVSLTQVQRQPQESHSNSICHILQESKHNRIISSEHKAGFILGI